MKTTSTQARGGQGPAATVGALRYDLYSAIHKALRALMTDTLPRVGRLDVTDDEDMEATLGRTDALLQALAHHLEHENRFIHPAIEARRPGAASATADAHVEHVDTLALLGDEVASLRRAPVAERGVLVARLYRHLALFIAENLEHMAVEESANQQLLWSLYTDEELAALHDRILASIAPLEMMATLGLMVRSLNPQELAGLFGGMARKMPPEAMRALFAQARDLLDDTRWAKLARALGLPPAPGLVQV
jgi:hypothetical protein